MAAIRISPGIYEVNGKRVNAKTADEAMRIAGGNKQQQPKQGGGNKPPQQQPILNKKTDLKTVPGAIEAERQVGDFEAGKGLGYLNPDVSGPFGGRRAVRDEAGNIVGFEDYLSGGGEDIARSDDDLTKYGRDIAKELGGRYNIGAGFNPDLAQRTTTGDLNADRARIEEEVFNRLTKTTEQDRGKDLEAAKQSLYNRGIAYSEDPNSRFQQELGDINRRYDDIKSNARASATQLGGSELERSFGINEQLIANQLSQQQGVRNQQIGELSGFANFGQGLRVPNMGPVQGYNYNLPSPTDIYFGQQQLRNQNRELDLATRRLGGGGGGASGAPVTNSPFNNSLPPGVQMNY